MTARVPMVKMIFEAKHSLYGGNLNLWRLENDAGYLREDYMAALDNVLNEVYWLMRSPCDT